MCHDAEGKEKISNEGPRYAPVGHEIIVTPIIVSGMTGTARGA